MGQGTPHGADVTDITGYNLKWFCYFQVLNQIDIFIAACSECDSTDMYFSLAFTFGSWRNRSQLFQHVTLSFQFGVLKL